MFANAGSFDRDLSSWCVPKIDEKPNNFDRNAGFEGESSKMPFWGCVDVEGLGRHVKDPDDDGLYEDVRGTGRFSILDVQVLFNNIGSPQVQNNSEMFNFQQTYSDVSTLDVQALFTEYKKKN
jgi:hypothetical protein